MSGAGEKPSKAEGRDIFTEPEGFDIDTLRNLGPLAALAGTWEGNGVDRHPVAAGAETWASTLATATAVPGRSPVHAPACSERPPARAPSGRISRNIFSSTTCSKRGSSAAKYASGGKPSAFDHIAL